MILISACLGGEPVRYDGAHCLHSKLWELVEEGKAVLACPELMGGLSTPREPSEIQGGNGEDVLTGEARVITITGRDVTDSYLKGAEKMLEIARSIQASCVVLKENSPSCGSHAIYDGSFKGKKNPGMGVTTALLRRHGFKVLSENEINQITESLM